MLRSILVPLDGTPFSERSLPLAAEVARASKAALHLARVHVPHEQDGLLSNTSFQWEGVDLSEYDRNDRRREEEYLYDVEARVGTNGLEVDSALLEEGDVSEQLCAYAREVDADAIFLTSHARGGIRRVALGSVADCVLRSSHLPVVIVHPSPGERDVEAPRHVDHILVPLDWSRLAGTVFGPVIDLAKAMGARVTLTSIVTPVVLGPKILPIAPEAPDEDELRATEYLEELADDLRAEGLDVDVLVVSANDPVRGIILAGEVCGADLIAMATHGFAGLSRLMAGSVTDRVLRESRVPMLVMRPTLEA
ncbi:MAG: universal stress protein [Longimicrobiales bacterium]